MEDNQLMNLYNEGNYDQVRSYFFDNIESARSINDLTNIRRQYDNITAELVLANTGFRYPNEINKSKDESNVEFRNRANKFREDRRIIITNLGGYDIDVAIYNKTREINRANGTPSHIARHDSQGPLGGTPRNKKSKKSKKSKKGKSRKNRRKSNCRHR